MGGQSGLNNTFVPNLDQNSRPLFMSFERLFPIFLEKTNHCEHQDLGLSSKNGVKEISTSVGNVTARCVFCHVLSCGTFERIYTNKRVTWTYCGSLSNVQCFARPLSLHIIPAKFSA